MNQGLLKFIDLVDYMANLNVVIIEQCQKGKATAQEVDYKTWARMTAHYPRVEITDEMHLAANTVLPSSGGVIA